MKINNIFNISAPRLTTELPVTTITEECSHFISLSRGLPLLKNLSVMYNDIHKVKVRLRKNKNSFTETFNEAFKHEKKDLRQRSIFANGESSFLAEDDIQVEPFYIFPINGFKFLYSENVKNSGHDYKHSFDRLLEAFNGNENQTIEIMSEVLKYNYISTNLYEGIKSGSEIILYNVPYYYAVRAFKVDNYTDLLTSF